MSEFSMLDEIEKYLLEIFENKAKSIENKQRFYERILKKIEQLEGEEKWNDPKLVDTFLFS